MFRYVNINRKMDGQTDGRTVRQTYYGLWFCFAILWILHICYNACFGLALPVINAVKTNRFWKHVHFFKPEIRIYTYIHFIIHFIRYEFHWMHDNNNNNYIIKNYSKYEILAARRRWRRWCKCKYLHLYKIFEKKIVYFNSRMHW